MTNERLAWDPVEPRMECRVCGSHVTWLDGRKHCGTCGQERDDMELTPATVAQRHCQCRARIIYRLGHKWCPACGWDPERTAAVSL